MKLHRSKLSQKTLSTQAKSGFTVVEITLVMAFVGLLLIAISTIFMNISAMYQKGLTIKTINSVGRNLVTELTSAINSAPSVDSISLCNTLVGEGSRPRCLADGAYKFIYQDYTDESYHDKITNTGDHTVQDAGVFCTGNYSYVWNTYYGNAEGAEDRRFSIKYKKTSSDGVDELKDFKIARFTDRTYRACSTRMDRNYKVKSTTELDITHYANGTENFVTDMQTGFLQTNENDINLSLYELTIFPISQDNVTLRAFFSGTFILATERGEVSVTRTGDYCDVGNYDSDGDGVGDGSGSILDLGSNFNYCGINRFNFAARTTGNGV